MHVELHGTDSYVVYVSYGDQLELSSLTASFYHHSVNASLSLPFSDSLNIKNHQLIQSHSMTCNHTRKDTKIITIIIINAGLTHLYRKLDSFLFHVIFCLPHATYIISFLYACIPCCLHFRNEM